MRVPVGRALTVAVLGGLAAAAALALAVGMVMLWFHL